MGNWEPEETQVAAEQHLGFAGSRCIELLIVADNPDEVSLIREAFQHYHESIAANLRVSSDGAEALRLLLSGACRPDIILLDSGLPDVDVQGMLVRLRSGGSWLKSVPIVVLSASNQNVQEIADSVASAYIVKPKSLTEYIRVMERFAIVWVKPLARAAAM